MSEAEIVEVEDTFRNLNSEGASISTDQEQKEIKINRATPDALAQIEELVNELHEFHSAQLDVISWLHLTLPGRLTSRVCKFLSEGPEQLPGRNKQEARLSILEAIGSCLQNAKCVAFIDTYILDKNELSSSEVEALYRRRLNSSTALDKIQIEIPENASDKWELESWRLLADMLLRAKSLDTLYVRHLPLSALSELSKAVAASGRSQSRAPSWIPTDLKKLSIEIGEWTDEALDEPMGEAIASHPSLSTLEILVYLDEDKYTMEDYPDSNETDDGTMTLSLTTHQNQKAEELLLEPTGALSCLSVVCSQERSWAIPTTPLSSLCLDFREQRGGVDMEIVSQILDMGIHFTLLYHGT